MYRCGSSQSLIYEPRNGGVQVAGFGEWQG